MKSQGVVCKFMITVLTLGSYVFAEDALNLPDFSATQVFESGKAPMAMKVHRSGESVRVDRSAALSTVYMSSKKKVYNLTTYPDQTHQCVVMKPEQARMLPSPLELLHGSNVKRTRVGEEVVEGHTCTVEKIAVTRPDGKVVESKVWRAQDLKDAPVKIESHIDEITLSAFYRDISLGAPDQALFTIPEKCTPFEKMWQVAEQKMVK